MKAGISTRARDDLECIYAHIGARRGIDAADRFLDRAKQAIALIERHPEARPHPSWTTRHESLRFWVISRTNYLVFYFSDEYGVSIERVLDGRRDVKRIIDQGLEEPEE